MKTIKSILIAATLISASVVSTMSAQQAAEPEQPHIWGVSVGDAVQINPDCEKYLTGERPSKWVYGKEFHVQQLGTKRFPEGVLLRGIISWVCEECLTPVDPQAAEKAKAAAAAKAAEEQAAKEEEARQAEAAAQQQEQQQEVTPVDTVQTTEPQPVEADTVTSQSTEVVQAAQDTAVSSEVIREAAKGDSIKSQQKFRHGYDRFTIGVRGGASALLHDVKLGNWMCGYDALLDLQYAHYWTKDGRPVDLGIITGIGIGYSASGMKAAVNSNMTVKDNDGDTINYTIKADEIKENDGQIQLEIPLMFSLIHESGFFFNIGPRFMLPVYTPYNQKISDNKNTYIDAYFKSTGVNVTNKDITGVLAESDYKSKGTDNGNQFAFNLMLGAELGYEWILKSGNSLGLGVYGNYCVFSTFKNGSTSTDPLIQVTPPTGASTAQVEVLSATKTYAEKLGFFDAGVKLAYHFNFPKKKQTKDAKLF